MTAHLKAHSPEWFKALEKINPMQADQTRQILSLVGRDDVCSVCGDDPAPEYETVGENVPRLRLCEDCRHLRVSMYGQKFLLIA
jgi:hypothetical protein